MLRWPFKKKDGSETQTPSVKHADAALDDDWAFLRTQPDHDADEMANVHGQASPDEDSAVDDGHGAELEWAEAAAARSTGAAPWQPSRPAAGGITLRVIVAGESFLLLCPSNW